MRPRVKSRAGSAFVAALVSPLAILGAAPLFAWLQFWRAHWSRFDAATLYFPDPRKPSEYILLIAIYALPAAWLMMVLGVPAFLVVLRRRAASWWMAAVAGALAGSIVAVVLGAPTYTWLLLDGVVYGVVVGVAFWWSERWVWMRFGPADLR
jgi:hypothetical protein